MKKTLLFILFAVASVCMYAQVPFKTTTIENGAFAEETTWYTMMIGNDARVISDNEGADYIALNRSYTNNEDKDLWCFVGNSTDGYTIYNKQAGAGKILASSAIMSAMEGVGGKGGSTYPTMQPADALPEGYIGQWDFSPSDKIAGVNGYFMRLHGTDYAVNNFAGYGKLAFWAEGADAGSTILIAEKSDYTSVESSYDRFKMFFTDNTCSEILPTYANADDETLMREMGDMPQVLKDIALKVKNNSWAPREKEFRVAEYKPHSNVYRWSKLLRTYQYSSLQNPTGITATTNDKLLIFIDDNLPQGIFLKLEEIAQNAPFPSWEIEGTEKYLKKGLNIVTVSQPQATLFISYAVTTDTVSNSKKLSDYPPVKIHIEGGYVNGYFDVERHNDTDWKDMLANNFKHYSVQVKGKRVLFHMELANLKKICPNTITDAIGWWDRCVAWQHELMGVDKYHDRWNSLLMARDGHEGAYMYATENYTYYEHTTLPEILPWATVYESPGRMWGPAHEIGHINQGAINIVSCTESSNNLFSNVQIHRAGKSTTRGAGLSNCIKDFNEKIPFPGRADAIGKSRMFFQLYLYFHVAEKDATFYPRLFEALRQDPLAKDYYTSATRDQLKFAEKCCEIAQMDLSEFFEAWGFFEPMTQYHVGDYGTYLVSLTEKEAEESRKRMQKYNRKGGHLMFIEDRIKPSKRSDGVPGNRIDFNEDYAIGKMGETGQWSDYIDESIKAKEYYYIVKNNTIEIIKNEDASGALGFKVYDADNNKLLTFANTHSITLPVYAQNKKYRVVAAQADGSDYEIPNAATSDNEAMQKKALEAKISSIMYIVLRTTTTGDEIGRYYADAVVQLKKLYNEAKAAVNNNDTSVHSYKEWIELIDEEVKNVRNNSNARAYLAELDVYNISNTAERNYYLCNDNMGLKANTNGETHETSEEKCWLVESTGEMHHYYIKNKNGKYINNIELGLGAMCSGSKEDAIIFKANYLDRGAVYFTTKHEGMYLTLNSDKKIVGGTSLVDEAVWYVTRIEQHNTAIELIDQEEGDSTLYDLHGRKVTNPGKGIYIKNGRVLIK